SIARALRPDRKIGFNLGYMLLKQSDAAGAVFTARKAIEQTPETDRAGLAELYTNLGMGLSMTGTPQEARDSLLKAIQLNPDNPEAHYHLGYLFWRKGLVDQAIPEFERATVQFSRGTAWHSRDVSFAYLALGNCRLYRKEFDAALAAFDKSIELTPAFATAHVYRGDALMEKLRVDEAIAEYREAIRLEPRNERLHL